MVPGAEASGGSGAPRESEVIRAIVFETQWCRGQRQAGGQRAMARGIELGPVPRFGTGDGYALGPRRPHGCPQLAPLDMSLERTQFILLLERYAVYHTIVAKDFVFDEPTSAKPSPKAGRQRSSSK